MRFPIRGGILALVVTVLLAGCVPAEPEPTPTASADPEPVFATEEEALAAAEEAYAAYLEMSDLIAADGGENPERIEPFVTESRFDDEVESLRQYQDRGYHADGSSAFDGLTVQQYSGSVGESTFVTVYVCLDVSTIRLLDVADQDVTPADRPNRLPLAVELEGDEPDPQRLRVSSSTAWGGDNFCAA